MTARAIPVDTGFIVFNRPNYPNLTGLFAHLSVPTHASDMTFAASIRDGWLEWGARDLDAVVRPAPQSAAAQIRRFWSAT